MIYGPAKDGYPIVNYEYAIVLDQAAQRPAAQADEGGSGLGHRPDRGQRVDATSTRSTSWRCPARWCRISTKLIAKVTG